MSKVDITEEKEYREFITDIAVVMKAHGIENLVAIFSFNDQLRNCYIPLGKGGEEPLYCNISDAFDHYLRQSLEN